MVNLRMLAIASAILLGTPLILAATHGIGHVVVPGGEVVDYYGEAAAEVTDIVLADLGTVYKPNDTFFRPEQVVEGHTTWLTIDIRLEANVTNASIDITGMVECNHNVSARGPVVFGVPIFNRVDRASAECRVGETVFVTPDPFYDSDNTYTSAMTPTGTIYPFTTPSGESGYAEEFQFFTIHEDIYGEPVREDYYAWSVPIYEPWIHTDGRPKAWTCPLPVDKLREMGVSDFTVVFQDDERLSFAQ